MTEVDRHGLTKQDRSLIFWASFLALAAASFGFVLRVMLPEIWMAEYGITGEEAGGLFGASLWPVAITMVLFSLVIDKIGYKRSMFCAFALQAASAVLTFLAKDIRIMWWACILGGLGHGVVEAVINPLCASAYRENKSKWLNILHASWPAGIVAGGIVYLTVYKTLNWHITFLFLLIPVVIYGAMFAMCHKYPVDERVEANIPMMGMLKEFGGLGAFLAITFLFHELANQIHGLTGALGGIMGNLLLVSACVGAVGGILFGIAVKARGKILFFILCLIMIPLATAELATDGWIQTLMRPVLAGEFNLHSGWAIVASAFIMMVLRFFAGVPLKFMSPPGLLLLSSVFSIAGLYLLSGAHGIAIFLAFALYAVGQTFYWPTVLGFVSERFPRGGAMTLNTVSAMGLLTVGIFGFPFLGAVKDNFDAQTVQQEAPALYEKYKIEDKSFFGWKYNSIKTAEVLADSSFVPAEDATQKDAEDMTNAGASLSAKIDASARRTIRVAAVLPLTMAIAFILILLWFRSQGGYKPIELTGGDD
ncbi:MAG: MFS transporter [Verrucomicrobia bacterium]|jgi:MFS family permease|nr:MFS transporter [Verrucomicrobiota bacterium]